MAGKKPYKRFSYSKKALEDALYSIKVNNKSFGKASIEFGIPKSTLIKKHGEQKQLERKTGPDTVLSKNEEDKLEEWIIAKARLGFPMHPDEVKDAVQKILQAENRPNPFTNRRPGKTWLRLYLIRHPLIALKNTEVISKARASVTEEGIRKWFAELIKYLTEVGALDILEDDSRMINLDETGSST